MPEISFRSVIGRVNFIVYFNRIRSGKYPSEVLCDIKWGGGDAMDCNKFLEYNATVMNFSRSKQEVPDFVSASHLFISSPGGWGHEQRCIRF